MSTLRAQTQLLKSRQKLIDRLSDIAIQKHDAHHAVDEKFAAKEADLGEQLEQVVKALAALGVEADKSMQAIINQNKAAAESSSDSIEVPAYLKEPVAQTEAA